MCSCVAQNRALKPQTANGECLKLPSVPRRRVQTTTLLGHFWSLLPSQHRFFLASQVNVLHTIFLLEIHLAGASPILEYQSSPDQCNPKKAKLIQTEKSEFSAEKTQATELIGRGEKYKSDPREGLQCWKQIRVEFTSTGIEGELSAAPKPSSQQKVAKHSHACKSP